MPRSTLPVTISIVAGDEVDVRLSKTIGLIRLFRENQRVEM